MIDVLYFLGHAKEMTYPMDLASALQDRDDISITVYSLFRPMETTHDICVRSLNAESRIEPKWCIDLYKILRRENPDIIHIHPAVSGSIARIVATAARQEPIVTTEHASHLQYSFLKSAVTGITVGLSDVVVANSEETLASFKRWETVLLQLHGSDTEIIHNGVDIPAVEEAADQRVDIISTSDNSEYLVGTVGRMVPVKNFRGLLRAGAKLLEIRDDVRFVLVGDGAERDSLEEMAKELGIDDQTIFTGILPRTTVYGLLHDLDVFTFTSNHEGFGNAAVEAMAAGVPLIANDIPPLREVIGEGGYFVDADDPQALAKSIDTLLNDKNERKQRGQIGKKRAMDLFSLDAAARNYHDLYCSLLDKC